MRNIRSRFTALAGLTLLTSALLITSQSSVQARPNTDGRWKIGDDGSCAFDANDSGPDQCDPTPGRNKIADDGSCYFDATDSGPDQCTMSH